jgi:hypothetical protein
MQQPATPVMSRHDQLRGVVILCRNFARNLAYYRVGEVPQYSSLRDARHTQVNFWRTTSNNFIDTCVLEWCKLFAEPKGKHCWSIVVSDAARFKSDLLNHLCIDDAVLEKEIKAMRQYRDKFLAHLDAERVMNVPALDVAKGTVWFYHEHVVNHERQPGDLAGLPTELDSGYSHCEAEAKAVYDHNI